MIKNLVFDFGRVLVDYDFKKLLVKLFDNPDELKEFYTMFCTIDFCNRCDKADVPFQTIVTEYKEKYPRWSRQIQEFHDRQLEVIEGEVPGMRDVLLRLKERGYGLYGLTNWSSSVYDVIEHYDILQILDGRLISSEEHLIKPEPAIYHRLCEKFSLNIGECLFTDDKQVNVDGAIAAGMDAVIFKDAVQYEEELRSRNIY